MPRGGARPNSGPKPNWNLGRTTTIRVPRVLASTLLRVARIIDAIFFTELIVTDEEIEDELANITSKLLTNLAEIIAKDSEEY